jgi:hypothetical protein
MYSGGRLSTPDHAIVTGICYTAACPGQRHETQFSTDDSRRRRLGSHLLFHFQRRRGRDAVVPFYCEWSDCYFGKLDLLVFNLQIRALPHDDRAKADTGNFDAVGPTRRISSRGRPVRRQAGSPPKYYICAALGSPRFGRGRPAFHVGQRVSSYSQHPYRRPLGTCSDAPPRRCHPIPSDFPDLTLVRKPCDRKGV